MLLGARIAAWDCRDLHGYDSDPLCAYWDGIDIGSSENGAAWADLVSGIRAEGAVTLNGQNATWTAGNKLNFGDIQSFADAMNNHHFSIECVSIPFSTYVFSYGYDSSANGMWVRSERWQSRFGTSSQSQSFYTATAYSSKLCYTAIVIDGNDAYGYRHIGSLQKTSHTGVVGDAAIIGNTGGYIGGTFAYSSTIDGNMTALRLRPFSMTDSQVAKYFAIDKVRFGLT